MSKIRVGIAQISYKPCYSSPTHNLLLEPFADMSTSVSTLGFLGAENLRNKTEKNYLDWLKIKLHAIIARAIEKDIDVLVFPEYSIPLQLLNYLVVLLHNTKMTIVAGTHIVTTNVKDLPANYPDQNDNMGYAICPVLAGTGVIGYSVKRNRSKWEATLSIPSTLANVPINIGKCYLDIRICIDALSGAELFSDTKRGILVAPSWSPSVEPFQAVSLYAKYNEIPMAYVNCSDIGGSAISAAYAESSHWFSSRNSTEPVPKNVEALVVSCVDLDRQFDTKGTAIEHEGSKVESVISILYGRDPEQEAIIRIIEEMAETMNYTRLDEILRLTADPLLIRKVTSATHLFRSGLLNKGKLIETLDYVKVNNVPYGVFLHSQAELMLKQMGSNMDNVLRDPNALSTIAALTTKISAKWKRQSADMSRSFETDERLFIGRNHEYYEISSFFSGEKKLLTIHGLRGMGKSKLIGRIKPSIIQEKSEFELFQIGVIKDCGYELFVDEMLFKLRIPSYGMQHAEIETIANRIVDSMSTWKKACLILDDFNYFLSQDNTFIDNRVELLIQKLLGKFDGNNLKLILVSSKKHRLFPEANGHDFEIARLDDFSIRWIISYCCSSAEYQPDVDDQTLRAIHGNPLAAILVAQLLVESKETNFANNAAMFQRFEERQIKNLIGELSTSDLEAELFSVLSVANTDVEFNFVKEVFPHLVLAFEQLHNRYLLELTNDGKYIIAHPLIRDHYSSLVSLEQRIGYHKQYADYYDLHESEHPHAVPAPMTIAKMIYHYAGSLQRSKLMSAKIRYVDQLKPIADNLYKKRKYLLAAEYYQVIFDSLGDARIDTVLKLAQCYVYLEKIKEAEKYIDIAIGKKPRAAYLYARYSIALANKYEYLAMAETYAFRAEEVYSEHSNHFTWELAEIKFAQAKVFRWTDGSRSIALYKQACDLEQTNCYYQSAYARALIKAGRIDDAKDCLRKIAALDPAYKEISNLNALLREQDTEYDIDPIVDENDADVD